MRGLNKITLEEFSDTLLFIEELFNKPIKEFGPVLDQIISDYRLAKEMIIIMNSKPRRCDEERKRVAIK